MKTPDSHDQITRWKDGAMSAGERAAFEAELQRNPELRAEAEALKNLSALLHRHATLEAPVPHGDFFNSQIQERIAELQRAERRAKDTPVLLGMLSWLTRRWAISAAAAVVLGLFAWYSLGGDESSQVLGFYAPNASVQASSHFDSGANAAVLMLDGLAAIPDDQPVSGLSAQRTVNDPEMATTTLYDSHGGLLLAMAADAGGTPQVPAH